jgi:hypothetical protein
MSSIANLVLNDGQATPVPVTFTPTAASLDQATWQDRSSGIYTGMPTIILSSRRPVKGSDLFKVRATMKLPIMEVVSNSTVSGIAPAPTIAYVMTGNVEFMLPSRSTQQNRKDLTAFIKNLLAEVQFTNLVDNFESPY